MVKIKEYVFKKKPEQKLEEKEEIVINKEEEKEKKIIANLNNQELKSYYQKKISEGFWYRFILMIIVSVFLVNFVLSIFELGMFKLTFFSFLNSYWSNLASNFAFFCLGVTGFNQEFRKKEKYEKLLKELKE